MKDNLCKGFILTTDSFIGVTLLALLMLVSLSYLSGLESSSWNFVDLVASTNDLSIILEQDSTLENSVLLSSSELLSTSLNSTPDNLCFEVSIFSENTSSIPVVSATKAGCTKNFSELIVVNRTLVVRDEGIDFYFAKIEGWSK